MNTILTLLSNSNPGGLILAGTVILICAAALVRSAIAACRIGHRYIFDGGDASVPCLVSFVVVFFVTATIFLHGFLTGVIKAEIPLMINIMFITLVSMMLRGRILGYPTANISSFKKTVMLFTGGIAAVIGLIANVTLYDSNTIIYFHGYTFHQVSYILYSSLVCTLTVTPGRLMPVSIFGATFFIELLLIYFDIKEFRKKKTIIADCLLITSTVIYFIFGVFEPELTLTPVIDTLIPSILFLFILAAMIINFDFETAGVLYRSTKINTVVISTQKLVDKIANKKNFTKNDSYRFNQIYKIIKNDKEVKEAIFAANYLSFNPKKRHLIKRLNEVCENEELLRRYDTPDYLGMEHRATR
jgi:hypothetical protein